MVVSLEKKRERNLNKYYAPLRNISLVVTVFLTCFYFALTKYDFAKLPCFVTLLLIIICVSFAFFLTVLLNLSKLKKPYLQKDKLPDVSETNIKEQEQTRLDTMKQKAEELSNEHIDGDTYY